MYDDLKLNISNLQEKKLSPKSKYIDNVEKEILQSFRINVDLISKIFNSGKDFKNENKKEYNKLKLLIIEKKNLFINTIISMDKSYEMNEIEKQRLKKFAVNINKYLLSIEKLILDLKNQK